MPGIVYIIYQKKKTVVVQPFSLFELDEGKIKRKFEEISEHVVWKEGRKFLILINQSVSELSNSEKIKTFKSINKHKEFITRINIPLTPIETFKLNNRTKRLIHFVGQESSSSNKFNLLSDCSDNEDDETTINKHPSWNFISKKRKEDDTKQQCNLMSEIKTEEEIIIEKNRQIDECNKLLDEVPTISNSEFYMTPSVDKTPQKSDSINNVVSIKPNIPDDAKDQLTLEMKNNIELLLKTNFITKGNYDVYHDRVILKKPYGNSYGDFIVNRHLSYFNGSSFEVGVSRISGNVIWDLNVKPHLAWNA